MILIEIWQFHPFPLSRTENYMLYFVVQRNIPLKWKLGQEAHAKITLEYYQKKEVKATLHNAVA